MKKKHKFIIVLIIIVVLIGVLYLTLNFIRIKRIKSLNFSPYYEKGARKECGVIAVFSPGCCLDIIKDMEKQEALFFDGGCPPGYVGLGVACGPFSPGGCYKTEKNLIEPVIRKSDDF